MRIVVTGALGHIGSALIRFEPLLAISDEIILIDDLSTQRYASLFALPSKTRYTLFPADVAEVFTRDLLKGCAAVVHLAAVTEAAASVDTPDLVFDNNLSTTSHVARVCFEASVPLVLISSTSVYTPAGDEVDETSATINPITPYAQCKLAEEAVVRQYVQAGLSAMIFRFGTIFGASPGMRFHTAVNKFCWQAAVGDPVSVWETAMDQRRPYLALEDATRAITRTVSERIYPGEVVNAVTCDATVREVLDQIVSAGVDVRVDRVRNAAMTGTSFTTSVRRATDLGFTFEGSLAGGVRETLAVLAGLLTAHRPT